MPTVHRDLTVLLVQPDRDDRDMYVEFLRHVGLGTVAVSTAVDAMSLAPHASVIVTGILLPGFVDGIKFVVRLKRDKRTKHIPVIVLTVCAWQIERDRASDAGCDLFLSKPCLPHVLAREIRRLLQHGVPRSALTPHAA